MNSLCEVVIEDDYVKNERRKGFPIDDEYQRLIIKRINYKILLYHHLIKKTTN